MFYSIEAKYIAILVLDISVIIRPHCQTVITAVAHIAVDDCRIGCTLTEIHTVGEIVADSAIDYF